MTRFSVSAALLGFILLVSAPAQAREMIYREDSGLTQAEYFLAKGKYSAAMDSAETVLKRRPGNADALTYRGYAEMQLGQIPAAKKSLKAAITTNPTHFGANKYLADIYLSEGKVARAREQMQVIRMLCGNNDCPELFALESAIDNFRKGVTAHQQETPEPKKEEQE